MTRVTLREYDGRYSVICEGHATGSVEICAAVSTLVYTLLGYLKNAGGVAVENEVIADGYAEIEFSGGECAGVAYELISIGFLQLAQAKGNFIEIFLKKF